MRKKNRQTQYGGYKQAQKTWLPERRLQGKDIRSDRLLNMVNFVENYTVALLKRCKKKLERGTRKLYIQNQHKY